MHNRQLIIAISSRALFDLDESNLIYEEEGLGAYTKYQIEHENDILAPGVAFNLVRKLLDLNLYGNYVEVILLSRNTADTGLRIFNSIKHYRLNITRAVFTGGSSPHKYAQTFKSDLFLSTNAEDVKEALKLGCAAATILSSRESIVTNSSQIRVAFDGDSVLFSNEAQKVYDESGLQAFAEHEERLVDKPLPMGPFHNFLNVLNLLQRELPGEECPIRIALVTARSAPTHERVIRSFRLRGIRIDESFFLGGINKTGFLKAFGADIFFDDQEENCLLSKEHVATGHVPQ